MDDDTGTDWAALADVLEDWPYGQPRVTKQEAELAAVGLRRLAQLDTAIEQHRTAHVTEGHPGDEPWSCCNDDFYLWAVSGSGEQPEGPTTAVSDCPTCWSTDPAKRWNDAAEAVCPDSWHGEQR